MKKKALAAAILAATTLSAAPAFAAQNPFKDIPKDHWAYDAVSMLAKDGVIDGYGDGQFSGDKLMNRYEMAQIVAKAAEKYGSVQPKDKGAINKLKKEFSAELKDMDFRLTNVESDVQDLKKNQSSFKWYGDARFRYMNNKDGKYFKERRAPGGLADGSEYEKSAHKIDKRIRLGLWGEPTKNVSVQGRLKVEDSTNNHDGWNNGTVEDNNNGKFGYDQLEFTWHAKNGYEVAAGRMQKTFGQGLVYWENPIDGISLKKWFGDKGNVQFGWGDMSAENWGAGSDHTKWCPSFFADGRLNLSKATSLTATYLKTNSDGYSTVTSVDEWGWLHSWGKSQKYYLNQMAFGLESQLAPKWHINAEYVRNNVAGSGRVNKDGFWARLSYGKQDWSQANTWKIYAEYAALGNYAVDSTGWAHHLNFAGGNGYGSDNGGARGWGAGLTYMLAKNTNLDLAYYKMRPYDTSFGTYRDQGYAAFVFSF